ncbi:AP2/ERF and B3 domain-containing protein Os01g0693400-like [Carex rostrata]
MNPSLLQQQSTEGFTSKENPCKLQSSRYRGVVPQHNGRWGAQIYECHRRIWLGTFADELEAACVYDIAALRFRGDDAATNFKQLCKSDPDCAAELSFLTTNTKAEIVHMLRNHTYNEELKISRRKHLLGKDFHLRKASNNRCVFEFLFNKMVTPSDIGKLNRLVIPKQHAEKHFPIRKDSKISINFQDEKGKVWRFTYCYWNSSQSYVMTKGWRLFVREKGVREGDMVSFWSSLDGTGFKQYLIEFFHRPSHVHSFVPPSIEERNHTQVTIRLFGVDICKAEANRTLELDEKFGNGKRERESELLPPEICIKRNNCMHSEEHNIYIIT